MRKWGGAGAASLPLLAPSVSDLPMEHVLVIVPSPAVRVDHQVWQECQALVAANYRVSVICHRGPDDPPEEWLDGVHLYRFRPPPAAQSLGGHLLKDGYAWLRTATLSLTVWRRHRFTVIQTCGSADHHWLLAWLWRTRRVFFVVDQHAVGPEQFRTPAKVPEPADDRTEPEPRWAELMSYRVADRVITPDEAHRDVAIASSRLSPVDVAVVHSAPDLRARRPIYPSTRVRPARYCLAYLGDLDAGAEVVIDVMDELVRRRGRRDVHATLIGSGDRLAELRHRTTALGLDDKVTFTGPADRATIAEHLSMADVGLSPGPAAPPDDASTKARIAEYLAHALPTVASDRPAAGAPGREALRFAPAGDHAAFADQIVALLDDPRLRVELGLRALGWLTAGQDWRRRSAAYVDVYNRLTDGGGPDSPGADEEFEARQPRFDEQGRRYVTLTDEAELRRFIRDRTAPR